MQKSNILLTFITIGLIGVSCKQDSAAKQADAEETTEQGEGVLVPLHDEEVDAGMIKMWRDQAETHLKNRIANDQFPSWASIEAGVWEYEFVHQNGKMSEAGELQGHWIDFDRDHSYAVGKGAKITEKGRYHYSPDEELVLMIPNNESLKPKQFKAKIAGDILIFSGNSMFRDNGRQSKLRRLENRPE